MPRVTISWPKWPSSMRARGAQAGNAADQEFVQQGAADEHDRPGAERADERADIGAEEGEHAAAGDQIEAGEHAQHEQLALGEVDDPHDAEDQPEADAHQAVDAADGDAGGERVQHVLDQDFEVHRLSCASRSHVIPAKAGHPARFARPACAATTVPVLLVRRLRLKRPSGDQAAEIARRLAGPQQVAVDRGAPRGRDAHRAQAVAARRRGSDTWWWPCTIRLAPMARASASSAALPDGWLRGASCVTRMSARWLAR